MKDFTVVMLWEQTEEVCVECVTALDAVAAGTKAQRKNSPEGAGLRVLAVFPGMHQDEWPGH